jgi:hypothetical protein
VGAILAALALLARSPGTRTHWSTSLAGLVSVQNVVPLFYFKNQIQIHIYFYLLNSNSNENVLYKKVAHFFAEIQISPLFCILQE